jgi:hypothetical protein
MELRFTDGTTTVEVLPTGGEAVLKRWTPQTPEMDAVDTAGATMDGGERPMAVYRNVTEQMDLVWEGSEAEQRASIQALNLLLQAARRQQRMGMGPRVYLEFRPDDAEDWWRSEILSGRLLVDDADLDFDLQLITEGLEGAVIYTRRFFWEGPEAQIPLTNGNGTDNITGLTVVNHDDADAGDDNYVAIDGDDVEGDLPTPPRIEITNTYENETRAYRVFLGHNAYSDPENLTHILEAEDATGGTPTLDANDSGGNYNALSWEAITETQLLNWTLTTEMLNALAGNYTHLVMRLHNATIYTNLWLRLRVKFETTTLWEGPQLLCVANQYLQDLGTVQLAPYLLGAGDLYPLHLVLYGTRAEAGTHVLNVDFLQVAPADGWRKLQPKGYGVGYEVTLTDDMIAGALYTEGWATAGKAGHYLAYGPPIRLVPGRDQRLYFLHDTSTGGAAIARTLAVKAFYRPRRLTP